MSVFSVGDTVRTKDDHLRGIVVSLNYHDPRIVWLVFDDDPEDDARQLHVDEIELLPLEMK
jgi:hypothetical protein